MELFAIDLGNRQVKMKSSRKTKVYPAYFIEASKVERKRLTILRAATIFLHMYGEKSLTLI